MKSARKRILCIVTAVLVLPVVLCLGAVVICNYPYLSLPAVTTEQLDGLDLSRCDKLMIVAHPDDEYLWGGAHILAEDGWFVVILTCAGNKTRRAENEVMARELGYTGLILNYPDKIAGCKSDWSFWEDGIRKDIRTILAYKDWKCVATHNAQGEYGHRHHKATHRLTLEAYEDAGCTSDLYFFGQYYRCREMPEGLTPIPDELLKKKESLTSVYESQAKTVTMFHHMIPYEIWEER